MRRVIKSIATVLCIGAIMFLAGGEWPENTPRNKAIKYDGGALLTVLVCGIYLRKEARNGKK